MRKLDCKERISGGAWSAESGHTAVGAVTNATYTTGAEFAITASAGACPAGSAFTK